MAITANTGSNNWNTNAAWVGGVQPTAADDVIIPASAVVTLPGSTTCYCRSLTVQASATLVWSNNTGVVLQVGDGTAGAGNVAVSISGTATISLLAAAGFGAINLASTSATQQTVSTGGKTLPNVTFGSASGNPSYLLSGALTSNHTVALTYGTLNTNGQTCSWGSFSSSNSNTRTLTLGSSAITLTGTGTVWDCGTSTNLTVTANTATITVATASSAARTFAGGGKTHGTLTYTVANSPGSLTITGSNTFGTLNVGPGRPLVLPSSATTTTSDMNAVGVPRDYVYLPGVTGNYLNAPDSVALSVTGDLDVRVRVAMDDWSPAVGQIFASKSGPYGQWSWSFYNTNGQLQWWSTTDGMNIVGAWSSAYLSTLDGTAQWVRVTRSASTGDVKFYTSPDGVSPGTWTQLGTTFSAASGAIYDGTAPVAIGAQDNGGAGAYALAGKLYRAQLRNGIDGTVVFDADLTTKQCGARTFVESSASAATVTINGTSARAGDGSVNLSASTPGTFATLAKAGGGNVYGLDYLSISDIHATP